MWNGVNDEELTRLSLFLFCFMFSNYKMMFSSKRCRQGCWSWVLCFLVPRINESFWVSKLKRVMLLGIWKTTAGRLFLKKGTEKTEKIKVNYLRVERLETRWSEERSALTTKRWIAFLRSELGEQMTGPRSCVDLLLCDWMPSSRSLWPTNYHACGNRDQVLGGRVCYDTNRVICLKENLVSLNNEQLTNYQ